MSENKTIRRYSHRGRLTQLPIYFGKLLRSFIYQNDWKVLPMSAVIAALISMVIRNSFHVDMEGTLRGAFALSCVAIWNGCFNSIQSVCRERDILKREHRSGLHVSSYIVSHMLYQALLCMAQSGLTVYVLKMLGVRLSGDGLFTPWLAVDIGITLFLLSYASDMLSLLISCIARTTTAAMTVMPFLLIFQLVFSGGFFSLPGWAVKISPYTISNPGMTCICAQADYNSLPTSTAWNTLARIQNNEMSGTVTVDQIAEVLNKVVDDTNPVSDVLFMAQLDPAISETEVSYTFTLRDIIDVFGRDKVKAGVVESTAATMRKPAYEHTDAVVYEQWLKLIAFSLAYAGLAMVSLKFIDKDKR